jgi:Domain of unknown function (DUF1707)/Cell wall-active antibiotics response 4TMS YvqF
MGGTPGGEEPAPGVRASDAERDATIERLSAATGDGRLTLEEFSQRMEQASSARTRAELERLVADLPVDAGGTSSAVAARAAAPATWHVSPIGGLTVRGPWRMDRHVVVVSLIGGADLDLSQAELAAPEVTLTHVSLLGGVRITVPAGVRVDRSGFSLIGGTRVESGPEPGPGAPTIHIRTFSLLGGVEVDHGRPAGYTAADRPSRRELLQDRAEERRSRLEERLERRRDRLHSRRERLRGGRGRFLD